jgi:uncharacterized membrane protein YebE (DUF533 family)
MFDPQRLLGQLLGDALGGDFGRRRKRGGGLSFGTKAQLGIGALGVAIAAYEHFSSQRSQAPAPAPVVPPPAPAAAAAAMPAAPPPPPAAFDLSRLAPEQADAVLLVRAMIAAAAADGVIDANERQRVLQRAATAGVDAETRAFLEAELAVPQSADRIGALTRPGLAREAYAAAALAIDLDSEPERRFLQTLGAALGLDEDARIAIHEQLEGRVV